MKRKRIILVALAVVLVVAAGIAVRRLRSPAPGLSAPIEMVEIQPGEFLMGSPEDEADRYSNEPQHLVRITYAFKMGKYEVTQKQWREVMGTTIQQQRDKAQERSSRGERLKGLGKAIKDNPFGTFKQIKDKGVWWVAKWLAVGERWPLYGEGDDYPMYWVNWEEAMEFCRRLTEQERTAGRLPVGHVYRLPTEAEWEYACRAGSITHFASGDTGADLDKIAWCWDSFGGTTNPVGTKLPNAWGLHDMHGNVWEWCLDWHVTDLGVDPVVDPVGCATGSRRVIRGGSWSDGAGGCRSASRGNCPPSLSSDDRGFRAALAPQ